MVVAVVAADGDDGDAVVAVVVVVNVRWGVVEEEGYTYAPRRWVRICAREECGTCVPWYRTLVHCQSSHCCGCYLADGPPH